MTWKVGGARWKLGDPDLRLGSVWKALEVHFSLSSSAFLLFLLLHGSHQAQILVRQRDEPLQSLRELSAQGWN